MQLDEEEVRLIYKEKLEKHNFKDAIFLTALHFRCSQGAIKNIVHHKKKGYPENCVDPRKDLDKWYWKTT